MSMKREVGQWTPEMVEVISTPLVLILGGCLGVSVNSMGQGPPEILGTEIGQGLVLAGWSCGAGGSLSPLPQMPGFIAAKS